MDILLEFLAIIFMALSKITNNSFYNPCISFEKVDINILKISVTRTNNLLNHNIIYNTTFTNFLNK